MNPDARDKFAADSIYMPAARVINRALQMQVVSGRAQAQHLQLAVFSGVVALWVVAIAGEHLSTVGQGACLGMVTAINAAMCAMHALSCRAHQMVLDTLGWDGWDITRSPQDSRVDQELKVTLTGAADMLDRLSWWQVRLQLAGRLFLALSLVFCFAGVALRIARRMP